MRCALLLLLLPLASSSSSSRSYCDESNYCDSSETCCAMPTSGDWMCCPFGAATCCNDGHHCCPADHPVCDMKANNCKTGGLLQLVFQNERTVGMTSSPVAVADSFDARAKWPSCVDVPTAMSACDSYLYPPLSAAYDRLCIAGVPSQGYAAGLSAVNKELPSDTECDSSMYDYAVLYTATYGLPTEQGVKVGKVVGISLEREINLKREVMTNGPVSVKLSSGLIGKLIGWTNGQWLLLDSKSGGEFTVLLETKGLVTVFSARD